MTKALNVVKALEFECPVCGDIISGVAFDSVDEFVVACGEHLEKHIHTLYEHEDIGKYVPVKIGMSATDVVKIMRVYGGYFDGDRIVVVLDKEDKGDE